MPIDSVLQQTVSTHYSDSEIVNRHTCGYVITGDQNIALISASVKYVISDPVAYALNVNRADDIIHACLSNAMLEQAAKTAVDDILTAGKEAYATEVFASSQAKLDQAALGISLQALELTNVSMPEEVREVYEQVNAATVKASTLLEEAQQYRNTWIPYAESVANTVLNSATGNYAEAISAATSDLAEFYGVLEEYKAAPDVVRARVYNTKMSIVMSKIGKVRLVDDGNSKIFLDVGADTME